MWTGTYLDVAVLRSTEAAHLAALLLDLRLRLRSTALQVRHSRALCANLRRRVGLSSQDYCMHICKLMAVSQHSLTDVKQILPHAQHSWASVGPSEGIHRCNEEDEKH